MSSNSKPSFFNLKRISKWKYFTGGGWRQFINKEQKKPNKTKTKEILAGLKNILGNDLFELAIKKKFGRMVALKGSEIVSVRIEDAISKQKLVFFGKTLLDLFYLEIGVLQYKKDDIYSKLQQK